MHIELSPQSKKITSITFIYFYELQLLLNVPMIVGKKDFSVFPSFCLSRCFLKVSLLVFSKLCCGVGNLYEIAHDRAAVLKLVFCFFEVVEKCSNFYFLHLYYNHKLYYF